MNHIKDFDEWSKLKKDLEYKEREDIKPLFFHEREIWWTSIGINIGHEQNGKNINFERPVIIIKKFNQEICWVIPLTSKKKGNVLYYYELEKSTPKISDSVAILSQIKLISSKRLLRKIGYCSSSDFKEIIFKTKNLFPFS